ncbi:MAG: tryptophan synthase subunit beta [Armatimonadetes bacterium]|nr:tryptophan synthase subunit beta [Armatimonadota bacterium]
MSATTIPAGRFGRYGGQYVPETLIAALAQIEDAYYRYKDDPDFRAELQSLYEDYAGRPTALYYAGRLSELIGCKVYLKREDLCHTGSHKINNTLGQGLLAKRMGKPRLLAETGAGQHGVAVATVAALFGMRGAVYMGEEDVRRQALNVFRMKLLGTEVIPVTSGTRTLKDAINEAFRDWMERPDDTFYVFGTVAGPHPFPTMAKDFQSVIGREVRAQCLAREGRLPTRLIACVGGGSNAMGIFADFIPDPEVHLIGAEAGGRGLRVGDHSAALVLGTYGILHGSAQYMLQDGDGQVAPAHSIAAGLDYPGVGPEHCLLKDQGRARYETVSDLEAVQAFRVLSETEGIIPALESAHAVALALKLKDEFGPDEIVVINVSGRGDKDCAEVAEVLEREGL